MTLHKGRGLTQFADNCFIHTLNAGGNELPMTLVGVIHRQETSARGSPPDCISGFDTNFTPFAKGHIMALELGGCDVSANIVPQYGMWQGLLTGAWRIMEVEIHKGSASAMVVQLSYDAVADTYTEQSRKFRSGKKLLNWTDPRIPTGFKIWETTPASIQPYLDADDLGKCNIIATGTLPGRLPPPNKVFIIDAMPQVDRDYWRAQMINHRARQAYEESKITPPPTGGGPVRAGEQHRALRRAQAAPYSTSSSRQTGAPLSFSRWIALQENRVMIALEFQNNTNNVAAGFTDFERQSVTSFTVEQAVFAG